MTNQEKYADKIAKLLRKAEGTSSTEEAESLVAKAQELMTSYAIDEAMIEAARGENFKQREKIVEENIDFTGIFQATLIDIGHTIARMNDCTTLYTNHKYSKPTKHVLHVIGFESDVDRVKMLNSSVQIQLVGAMTQWWKELETEWMSKMDKFKTRREFIQGFNGGLSSRLHQAKKAGEREAVMHEAERSEVSEEQAAESVALVVRSRKDQVKDWRDEKYGKLRSVSRSYNSGTGLGYGPGREAGSRADLGGGKVGGKSRELDK